MALSHVEGRKRGFRVAVELVSALKKSMTAEQIAEAETFSKKEASLNLTSLEIAMIAITFAESTVRPLEGRCAMELVDELRVLITPAELTAARKVARELVADHDCRN